MSVVVVVVDYVGFAKTQGDQSRENMVNKMRVVRIQYIFNFYFDLTN